MKQDVKEVLDDAEKIAKSLSLKEDL